MNKQLIGLLVVVVVGIATIIGSGGDGGGGNGETPVDDLSGPVSVRLHIKSCTTLSAEYTINWHGELQSGIGSEGNTFFDESARLSGRVSDIDPYIVVSTLVPNLRSGNWIIDVSVSSGLGTLWLYSSSPIDIIGRPTNLYFTIGTGLGTRGYPSCP